MHKNREQLLDLYRRNARTLRESIRKEVGTLRPLGAMSELGALLGIRPKHGVMLSTPLGLLVFAKERVPTDAQLQRWEDLESNAALYDKAWAEDGGFFVCKPHTIIGNRLVLEQGERLMNEGLLDEEERNFVWQLKAFWATYTDAKTGLVVEDGIQPLYD